MHTEIIGLFSWNVLCYFAVDLEWKIIYVGSADNVDHDQVLDSVLVGPVPIGKHRFVFLVNMVFLFFIPLGPINKLTKEIVSTAFNLVIQGLSCLVIFLFRTLLSKPHFLVLSNSSK